MFKYYVIDVVKSLHFKAGCDRFQSTCRCGANWLIAILLVSHYYGCKFNNSVYRLINFAGTSAMHDL